MKRINMLAISMLFASMGIAQIQPAPVAPLNSHAKEHHIVMQLSSNDTLVWKALMNNLRHLNEGWKDIVEIEVVAHGPGIEMLLASKTTQAQKIKQFAALGVRFLACENTMREKNIPHSDLITDATLVPMGIGEIVMKQEQGWSYIKSGF
jgi:uncharacterized protein